MTISVGDKLPDITFKSMTAEGPLSFATADIFDGRKVVLFAVPGAFTPTCHNTHLPEFVANASAIKAKGVDTIACVSVNDVHVMTHWGNQVAPDGNILMLADGNGDFARATGTDIDLGVAGMGLRSRRYAMIVDDGVVEMLSFDDKPGQVDGSGAKAVLKAL